jgi:hypothetical protein
MFEELLASLRSPGLAKAPERLRQLALEHIRTLQGKTTPIAEIIRGTIADAIGRAGEVAREIEMQLVADSHLGATLAGIRSETALQPRQMLFESEEGSVHLRISRTKPRRFGLTGQFIPHQGSIGAKARVLLECEGKASRRTLGATGEFRFASLKPGPVRLAFEWDDLFLTAGPLELPEDPDA